MELPNPLDAVILDMDGTLHDTECIYHEALKRAVTAVGFSVTDGFVHSLIGIPGKETDEMLQTHLGPRFPFDAYDRLYDEYCETLMAEGIRLKPGVTELLDFLEACALPVAIATSASRRAATLHLMRSGLGSRITKVVTRDDVTRGKPHPDVYLEAAHRVGAAPERCLAVEDSFNGIRAAHAAGMMPVMVPDVLTPTPEIRALCVTVAADLHAVRNLIARP
ncbi:MAG TPA: HAD family phosphatase [Acetobacteraceae bacterium]|nr:HAD family phosphatase [Acetobacteraceae bacterium]